MPLKVQRVPESAKEANILRGHVLDLETAARLKLFKGCRLLAKRSMRMRVGVEFYMKEVGVDLDARNACVA